MNTRMDNGIALLKSQVERLERIGLRDSPSLHFARAVLGPAITIMDCDECQEALPEIIEAELNNQTGSYYYDVHHHLSNCRSCYTMYLDLLEIALLVEVGPWPQQPIMGDDKAETDGDEEID